MITFLSDIFTSKTLVLVATGMITHRPRTAQLPQGPE
jgi:hypothetical protein